MKGIVFVPGKRTVITTDFGIEEPDRIHEIIDIKAIPYRDNIIYGRRKEQTSLPENKGMYGCAIGGNSFLGNIVILGIDDKGNDLDCSLDAEKIYQEFQIKVFTRNECVDDSL